MMDSSASKFPCPCCGYLTHVDPPGSSIICPVCYWEDDLTQLRWPDLDHGANRISLISAQRSYSRIGACSGRFREKVRSPLPGESRDPDWRPVDRETDNFESSDEVCGDWPEDRTGLYWWRATYWRKPAR